MKIFYSYLWLREDGTPYYVGKGTGRRAFTSAAHGVHRPKARERILVFPMRDEADAFASEVAIIALFGRKDLGTGCLRNLTDGGDGPSGHVHSEVQKSKIRKSLEGNQRAKGHHWALSEETKERMSRSAQTRTYRRGFHLSAEHRRKIGIASRRYRTSAETRAKLSAIALLREENKRQNS